MDLGDFDDAFAPRRGEQESSHLLDTVNGGFLQNHHFPFDSAMSSVLMTQEELYPTSPFSPAPPTKSQLSQASLAPDTAPNAAALSPDSSFHESSSDSSGPQDRRVSQSGTSSEGLSIGCSTPMDLCEQAPTMVPREHSLRGSPQNLQTFEDVDAISQDMATQFDFNAASSSDAIPTTGYAPRAGRRHVAIPHKESPLPTSSFAFANVSSRLLSPRCVS